MNLPTPAHRGNVTVGRTLATVAGWPGERPTVSIDTHSSCDPVAISLHGISPEQARLLARALVAAADAAQFTPVAVPV